MNSRWGLPLALLVGACTVMPTGPSVLVLPGTGKSLAVFRGDDASCRQYALQQSGGRATDQIAADSAVRSAVVGTVVGALAGAAIGGNEGAGVGAGTGLLMGSMVGGESGYVAAADAQRRFDHGYIQCMYMLGHRVPVSGRFTVEQTRPSGGSGVPSVHSIPPPPAGLPPPPPPDVPTR